MNVEISLPNNAADDDLESDPVSARNCGRMYAFEREYYHSNIMAFVCCFHSEPHIRELGEGCLHGIFNGIRVFGMEMSKPVPSFLRFEGCVVRLNHKHQTLTRLKCNRSSHQARICPNGFCFNCEELGPMTDSCTEEFY